MRLIVRMVRHCHVRIDLLYEIAAQSLTVVAKSYVSYWSTKNASKSVNFSGFEPVESPTTSPKSGVKNQEETGNGEICFRCGECEQTFGSKFLLEAHLDEGIMMFLQRMGHLLLRLLW